VSCELIVVDRPWLLDPCRLRSAALARRAFDLTIDNPQMTDGNGPLSAGQLTMDN
jgi:hypothetical protein